MKFWVSCILWVVQSASLALWGETPSVALDNAQAEVQVYAAKPGDPREVVRELALQSLVEVVYRTDYHQVDGSAKIPHGIQLQRLGTDAKSRYSNPAVPAASTVVIHHVRGLISYHDSPFLPKGHLGVNKRYLYFRNLRI